MILKEVDVSKVIGSSITWESSRVILRRYILTEREVTESGLKCSEKTLRIQTFRNRCYIKEAVEIARYNYIGD